jgi:hypothetical protein
MLERKLGERERRLDESMPQVSFLTFVLQSFSF